VMWDSWPGEKLLIKIWESVVDSGFGNLLSPLQIKREGKARTEVRRQDLLMLADVEQIIKDVRAGKKTIDVEGQVHEVPLLVQENSDLALATTHPIQTASFLKLSLKEASIQAVRKTSNLQKILMKAEEVAEGIPDQEVSDEGVSQDWINRFRTNAEDITDDKLQELWGRILAGEFKDPGSYSFKTLELMRGLGTEDAMVISKIAPFRIAGFVYNPRDKEKFYSKYGISYNDFLYLEDLGILNAKEGLQSIYFSTGPEPLKNILECNGWGLLIRGGQNLTKIEIPAFIFTKSGNQIMALGAFAPNVDYLKEVGTFIKSKGADVTICECKKVSSENYDYWNQEKL